MAHHWHFVRLTQDRSAVHASDGGDLRVFFAFDMFATTDDAAQAIADDLVSNYPRAKAHPGLPKIPAIFADQPVSAFYYRPSHPTQDLIVGWLLRACSGGCRMTMREFCQQARSHTAPIRRPTPG